MSNRLGLVWVQHRCAMALVHSRIRRVVYAEANSRCGALGSRVALHVLPQLNHKFRVRAGGLSGMFHALLTPVLFCCSCAGVSARPCRVRVAVLTRPSPCRAAGWHHHDDRARHTGSERRWYIVCVGVYWSSNESWLKA